MSARLEQVPRLIPTISVCLKLSVRQHKMKETNVFIILPRRLMAMMADIKVCGMFTLQPQTEDCIHVAVRAVPWRF